MSWFDYHVSLFYSNVLFYQTLDKETLNLKDVLFQALHFIFEMLLSSCNLPFKFDFSPEQKHASHGQRFSSKTDARFTL